MGIIMTTPNVVYSKPVFLIKKFRASELNIGIMTISAVKNSWTNNIE